jgi:hypothetical protein
MRNRTARQALDYKTPHEVMLGKTPDISELFDFGFYQPVLQYMDYPKVKFPQLKTKLGRWLGIATSVGQAMCYYILTVNGTVITRSTVKSLDKPEAPQVRREIKAYDSNG